MHDDVDLALCWRALQRLVDNSVQALALTKFAATVLFTSLTQPASAHAPGSSLAQAPGQQQSSLGDPPPDLLSCDATQPGQLGQNWKPERQGQQKQQTAGGRRLSRRARRIMTGIGCLDVVAYGLHCSGFALCGAATASVVFAAAAQALTALLTRFALGRHLRPGQYAAVTFCRIAKIII